MRHWIPKGAMTMARAYAKDYYTVAEAAEALGVSPSTIWRWIKSRRLPAYRVGPKNIRIEKADLEAAVRPAREENSVENRTGIWAGYDPEKLREALDRYGGMWSDIDAGEMIANIHRWREEGSRPADRPRWPS